jgi:hypothetical protein
MTPMYENPGIEFDRTAFDPMQIMPVTHRLMEHPLLQLPQLVELAGRLGTIRFHDDAATAATDFITAPKTHRIDRPPIEIVRDIENARAWMAFHHIQKDPEYRILVAEVLDWVRPMIAPMDSGMRNRAGWIFVTSPGAVTPYHMDHEHNFILQIRGTKTLHVFPPLDREIVTERCLEMFHQTWSRELVTYDEQFESKAKVFDLIPGMGGYMPTTAPHWVKNGPDVSITASFTYYSRETLRREAVHCCNHMLRRRGMKPLPVGRSTTRDWMKSQVMRHCTNAKRSVKRLMGRRVSNFDSYYSKQ